MIQKTKASNKLILKKYLDSDCIISRVGGRFTGRDFYNILKVLEGSKDYMFFDNAGGKKFTIWFWDDMKNEKSTIEDFKELIKRMYSYMFMYNIEGVDFLVNNL